MQKPAFRAVALLLNMAKADHQFGYVNGTYADGYQAGRYGDDLLYWLMEGDDLFECKDDVKGDVARILLYVYCRWEQPNLYSDIAPEKLPVLDEDDQAAEGSSSEVTFRYGALDRDLDYTVAIVDDTGEIQSDERDVPKMAYGLITCKKSFFRFLIAVLRAIFRLTPKVTVAPAGDA